MDFEATLQRLEAEGNLRRIPEDIAPGVVDFTSNDYLGIGGDEGLRESFFEKYSPAELKMTSSASRLLAGSQKPYRSLERLITDSYGLDGRETLLFNSGYHANTGIIAAIADRSTVILADRLVHASIIDGIRLSGARLTRFGHNDFTHLEKLVEKEAAASSDKQIIVIVESVYSMDGDRADLRRLAEIKSRFPKIILYVDEAHAVGACGPGGLGEAMNCGVGDNIDIIVGTFGKALASAGAYALVSRTMHRFLINKARALIFSTALPPAQILWTEFVWKHALGADDRRRRLAENAREIAKVIDGGEAGHIRPLVVGEASRVVAISRRLLEEGFNVLPIRTPTVPAGTERLRFSLSASHRPEDIRRLKPILDRAIREQ